MSEPPKPTALKEEPLPVSWKQMPEPERKNWLDTQPLPSDTTVSLLSCYNRGVRLTQIFSLVYDVINNVKSRVEGKSKESNIYKAGVAFINAFNAGFVTFSNKIANDCNFLLENGKYPDFGVPLRPVFIEGISLDALISTDSAIAPEKPKEITVHKPASFWEMFCKVLAIICDDYAVLNQIQPGMNASYADLLKAVAQMGSTFFDEWNKEEGAEDATFHHEHKQEAEMDELDERKQEPRAIEASAPIENDEGPKIFEKPVETMPEVLKPAQVVPISK